MKRIMCARCKQGIEPDKINKITPNTFVCNSCYDELLQVDMRSTNRNMEERHKVLAALTFEEYLEALEDGYKCKRGGCQVFISTGKCSGKDCYNYVPVSGAEED